MKKKQLNRERSGGLRLLSLLLAVVMLCGLLIPGGAMVMNTYADEMEAAEVAESTVTEDEPAEAPGESTDTPSETPAETPADPPAEEVPAEDEAPAQEETPAATPEEPEQPDQTEKPVESSDADKSEESGEPNAVDALYDRLMACETLDEINAILDNLSDEEAALMDQFTAEQEAALEAHLDDLGYYDTAVLSTLSYTIKQGATQAVAVSNISSSNFSYDCAQQGITATRTSDGYTISVASSVPVGTHILTVKYQTGWWSTTDNTDTVTITVPADFIITNHMENTEVAYVDFRGTNDYQLTSLKDGDTVSTSGESGAGVLLFFIKPKDGYLLTEYKRVGGDACDLYAIDVSANETNIQHFKDNADTAQQLLNDAKADGYLGYYAFTYGGKSWPAVEYNIKAERPPMTVTAVADKTKGVKPGDTVTYTVTITPGHTSTGVDEVTSVTVTSMTINGTKVEDYSTLQENKDGTYTTTVTHTVTMADWEAGEVKLQVGAEVAYSYTITLKDRNNLVSSIPTEATVPNEASVSVPVAPKTSVRYVVTHNPEGLTPPDSIETGPYDAKTYYENQSVTVNSTYGTEHPASGEPAKVVDDPANGGTWSFDGWYKDAGHTQKADATETVPKTGLVFYGVWKFERYPTTTLTVTKQVKGNMGSWEKKFQFTVSYGETVEKFELAHDDSEELTVPTNTEVTITESDNTGYTVTATVDGKSADVTDNAVTLTTTTKQNGHTVVFTNEKEATIDTGVVLDSLPYLVILAVVVVAAVVVLLRKRRMMDEE